MTTGPGAAALCCCCILFFLGLFGCLLLLLLLAEAHHIHVTTTNHVSTTTTTTTSVGNLFRMQLLRDPSVQFAGYYHPHPLVYYINLKIQTSNATVAPVEVLSSAIEDLANETDHLITQFQDALEDFKRKHDDTEMMGGVGGGGVGQF